MPSKGDRKARGSGGNAFGRIMWMLDAELRSARALASGQANGHLVMKRPGKFFCEMMGDPTNPRLPVGDNPAEPVGLPDLAAFTQTFVDNPDWPFPWTENVDPWYESPFQPFDQQGPFDDGPPFDDASPPFDNAPPFDDGPDPWPEDPPGWNEEPTDFPMGKRITALSRSRVMAAYALLRSQIQKPQLLNDLVRKKGSARTASASNKTPKGSGGK